MERNTIDLLTGFILTQTAESSPRLRTSEDCRAVASAKAGPTDYHPFHRPLAAYRSPAFATDTTSSSPTSRATAPAPTKEAPFETGQYRAVEDLLNRQTFITPLDHEIEFITTGQG